MTPLRDALAELPDAIFADLLESDDAYLLVLDLPGVTRDTLDITATSTRLRVEARRAKDLDGHFQYLREERPVFVDFDLPLPPDAVGPQASARMDRGVLQLEVPRSADGTEIPVES